MNKPVEPKKEILTPVRYTFEQSSISSFLKEIDSFKKEYPMVSDDDIYVLVNHYNGSIYLEALVLKRNFYYDEQMRDYKQQLKVYEELLLAKEIKEQSKIDKKNFNDQRRTERILKKELSLQENSDSKIIFVDNKKYEVKLLENFNVKDD